LGNHIVNQHSMNVDSLHSEIFILQTELGRWELSLQHLYEVNPASGKEFTQFMEHETE
jgi:hypothetical protein